MWGPFKLIARPTRWQATCPWHRGMSKLPQCRKTLGFGSFASLEDGKSLIKRKIKLWCVKCLDDGVLVQTQHAKVPLPSTAADIPEDDELELLMQALPPPPAWEEVLPEDLLMAIAESLEPAGHAAASSSATS